jgi:hypothetical protein
VAEVGVDFGAVLRPRPAAKAADAKVNIMATHKRMLRVLFIRIDLLHYFGMDDCPLRFADYCLPLKDSICLLKNQEVL